MNEVKALNPLILEMLIEMYDSTLREQPENCKYMYGRKVFGFIYGTTRYDIDNLWYMVTDINAIPHESI